MKRIESAPNSNLPTHKKKWRDPIKKKKKKKLDAKNIWSPCVVVFCVCGRWFHTADYSIKTSPSCAHTSIDLRSKLHPSTRGTSSYIVIGIYSLFFWIFCLVVWLLDIKMAFIVSGCTAATDGYLTNPPYYAVCVCVWISWPISSCIFFVGLFICVF